MTGFPFRSSEGLDPELVKYLDKIGKPISNVAALGTSPTNEEIATFCNALRSALISGGKMVS
jgi:hypothetical protein